jgi:putative component of membrane protein insertase Oxa1/YidC/SpoIIIJ protein YidD
MRINITFIILLLVFSNAHSQSNNLVALKRELMLQELGKSNAENSVKKKKGIGNALLTVYQKHISVLISADCLYTLSCSRYSREVINKYGFIPGVLLTADRLTRCSFFCSKDIPDSKFTKDGHAIDNP